MENGTRSRTGRLNLPIGATILRKRQWSSTRSRGLGPICAADVASSQVVFQTGWVVCARRTDPRARGCRRGLGPEQCASARGCVQLVSVLRNSCSDAAHLTLSRALQFFFFWVGRARASDRVRGSFHIPHTQLWAAVSDRGREGLGGARPAHAEPGSMRHRKNTRGWARVPRLVAAAMPICDRRATGGGMSYRIVPEPTSVLCVDRGVGVPDGCH